MSGSAGPGARSLRAIVLADGDRPSRRALDLAWPGWDADVGLVIAADGGARLAADLGRTIHLWVGDGDSLGPDELAGLRASGVPVELASEDKDESDTELAVVAATARGATDVTILGALGGRRVDHALANVALLAHPALAGRRARLLDGGARVSLLAAAGPSPVELPLPGRVGDLVSLLPFGGAVEGVVTRGLGYPLRDEPLLAGPARGLSNVRTDATASVAVRRGLLLIVESPATLSR